MTKVLIPMAAFLMVACSSEPVTTPVERSVQPSTAASEPGPDETKPEPSQILNRNKKCPRKTKLVNGKCVISVETTE
jgi:hypothetical protein